MVHNAPQEWIAPAVIAKMVFAASLENAVIWSQTVAIMRVTQLHATTLPRVKAVEVKLIAQTTDASHKWLKTIPHAPMTSSQITVLSILRLDVTVKRINLPHLAQLHAPVTKTVIRAHGVMQVSVM